MGTELFSSFSKQAASVFLFAPFTYSILLSAQELQLKCFLTDNTTSKHAYFFNPENKHCQYIKAFHTSMKVYHAKLLYMSQSKSISNGKAEVRENYFFFKCKGFFEVENDWLKQSLIGFSYFNEVKADFF